MRIVCSIDDSAAARHAAELARRLAGRAGAELIYVHSETGVSSDGSTARDRACDLLIVGYAPRSGLRAALLGQAHRRLVRDAPCPVMLVPDGARVRAGARVVLGYDVPELPRGAAATAGRLAAALDVPLVIAHVQAAGVGRRPTGWQVYDAARRITREAVAAGGRALHVEAVERAGRPHEQLADAAAAHDGAVIVVGRRRAGRCGSVAARLQRHARHPVVVVPPGAAALAA